nr:MULTISPECIES: glutaredoxin domain-containing protein [unclassified Nocardioides]
MLWRPGCPFCSSLRRGLRHAGVATVEHDIWASPAAAARLREVTGGDEIVPTVIVGAQSLVNPSVRQVLRALETEYPEHHQEASAADEPPAGPSGAGFAGPVWTAVVTAAWLVLAGWQPSTTWHLAPLLVAAAWPWVVGQHQSPDDPSARRRIVVAAVAGLTVASLATGALAAIGHLEGPTWTGSGSTVAEALLLAGAGSLLAMVAGLARTVRRVARD